MCPPVCVSSIQERIDQDMVMLTLRDIWMFLGSDFVYVLVFVILKAFTFYNAYQSTEKL